MTASFRPLSHSTSLLGLSSSASSSSPSIASSSYTSNARKYGTVTLSSRRSQQHKVSNTAFDENGNELDGFSNGLDWLIGLTGDEEWSISMKENVGDKKKRKGYRSKSDTVSLTLYVTTHSSSSTLIRDRQEIVQLDERLRSDIPNSRLPVLSSLPTMTETVQKRRTILAAISSLSPRRSRISPSPSTSLYKSDHLSSVGVVDLSSYLTNLSQNLSVRAHGAWKAFFAVREDDLQSTRVERRISRTRSDRAIATTRSSGMRSLQSRLRNHFGDDEQERVDETLEHGSVNTVGSLESRIVGSASSSHSHVPTAAEIDRTRAKKAARIAIGSFDILRVLGKGCAGKVLLVRRKRNGEVFAMKAIQKKHVLAHRELEHTQTEQFILKRCTEDALNPFVVKMACSFHDQSTLYLALEFHSGGDLATQLARWGQLGRDRARFYAAELVVGVAILHRSKIIYRDLKPENVLISSEGHIVLTDFGLSKDFRNTSSTSRNISRTNSQKRSEFLIEDTTTTFCGTAEYLAPEVILGCRYSYSIDWWSLGTMLYEMLSGITPFWAENHAAMYKKVLSAPLIFDDDDENFDEDTKHLIRGLLQRDPLLRMSDQRIKRHPYFALISWNDVHNRRYIPPFIPALNRFSDGLDTQNFDDAFLAMDPGIGKGRSRSTMVSEESDGEPAEGEPEHGFDEDGVDIFDGYSFSGTADDDELPQEPYSVDVDQKFEITGGDRAERKTSIKSSSTRASVALSASSPTPLSPTFQQLMESPSYVSPTKSLATREDRFEEGDGGIEDEWDLIDQYTEGEAMNGLAKRSRLRDRYRLMIRPSGTPRGSNSATPRLDQHSPSMTPSSASLQSEPSPSKQQQRSKEYLLQHPHHPPSKLLPNKLVKPRLGALLPGPGYNSKRLSTPRMTSDEGGEAKRGTIKRTLIAFLPSKSSSPSSK